MRSRGRDTIRRGVHFLAAEQQPDGSFASYSSPTERPFRATVGPTTFTSALIVGALTIVKNDQTQEICNRLATWLVSQKSPEWSFNYSTIDAAEQMAVPHSDDLGTTFGALIGLHLHDPQLTDTTCLAKMVRLLLAAEKQVGGPYRTWLGAPAAPRLDEEIDLVANAQVAYFLNSVAAAPPNLTTFIEQAIIAGTYSSPYYPSWHAVIYFVARGYNGPHAGKLIDYILKRRRNGHWGTPLHTALALLALLRLGYTDGLESAVSYLIDKQRKDGSWPPEAFCLSPEAHTKQYSGSAALTTAFILEALAGFELLQRRSESKPPAIATVDTASQKVYVEIVHEAQMQFRQLHLPLRRIALAMLDRMDKSKHNREIVLLPLLFAKSLQGTPRIPAIVIHHLGLANLYGWMAYTIYDDFLDDEGNPQLLSVANVALRYSLLNFQAALPEHEIFQKKVVATFDKIDEANAWEVTRCRASVADGTIQVPGRLPSYRNTQLLADRSLGHLLTPFGVLASLNIDLESEPVQHLEAAFKHYLAARQLNDDLHDWRQDLHAGHCTYVVTKIYKELGIPFTAQSLTHLLPRMQHQFWNHTLLSVCRTMSHQTTRARQAADASRLFAAPHILTELSDTIDASICLTRNEHNKATKFLTAYTS